MFSLVLVLGVWLNPHNLSYLYPHEDGCVASFSGGGYSHFKKVGCSDLATIITKKMGRIK